MHKYLARTVTAVMICAPMMATSQTDIPNLEGLWKCDIAQVLLRQGEWSTLERQIDVTEQRGALFQVTQTWALNKADGVTGHANGKRIAGGTIPLIGVINFDNSTFVAGAVGDNHITRGHMIDDNTFRIASLETGDHAWVTRTTCFRDEGG